MRARCVMCSAVQCSQTRHTASSLQPPAPQARAKLRRHTSARLSCRAAGVHRYIESSFHASTSPHSLIGSRQTTLLELPDPDPDPSCPSAISAICCRRLQPARPPFNTLKPPGPSLNRLSLVRASTAHRLFAPVVARPTPSVARPPAATATNI